LAGELLAGGSGQSGEAPADPVRLAAARGCPAQLCVISHGQVILDEAIGCRPDSLFFLFSASKPMVALLVHQLAERGELSLDDPVARYWPEFGRRGKDSITIRQVLRHRSGLPVARNMALDALTMTDWSASVRALERAAPSYPPGQVPAYHVLSYGFILGELVQRVTGTPVRDVLAAELLRPLGLQDTYLGLPPGQWERHVPVSGHGLAELATGLMINRRAVRQAVIPAASVSATARDLARFYQALLAASACDHSALDGVRVLRPETIAAATRPTSDGETDRYLKLPVRWSEGFQLGGERGGPVRSGRKHRGGRHSPMGECSSPTAFGHNGSYVCIGWADPQRQLAVGYLTGRLISRAGGARHMAQVSDAILATAG
jgi:CubicO group peptidase (beta-lactamase class C family)